MGGVKRPKIGRPPRAGEAATKRVEVRCTSEERERLEALAQRRGESMSDVVRSAIALLLGRAR